MSSTDPNAALKDRLHEVEGHWRAWSLSTEPIDRARAEDALHLAYCCAGKSAPAKVYWVASPPEGLRLLDQLGPESGHSDVDLIGDLQNRTRAAIRDAGPSETTLDLALCAVTDSLEEIINLGTVQRVGERIESEVVEGKHPPSATAFMDLAYSGYYTQFWTAWVESIEVLGVEAPGEWRGLAELGRTAHWFWAFEEFAVMVERPVLLRVDSRGLIVEKGRPTIAYGDGWSL